MNIKNKTIFITGGTSGIGFETAKLSAQLGSNVVVYSISPPMEKTFFQKPEVLYIKGDICNIRQCQSALNKTIKKFGDIDVLINNAGIVQRKEFINTDKRDWNKIIHINIKGTLNITKEFLKIIQKLGTHKRMIINISSGAGLYGIKDLSIYSLTKSAIINFTQSLQQEISKDLVEIITITPGSTDTQMFRKAFPEKDPKNSPLQIADAILKTIEGKLPPNDNLVVDVFKHTR